MEKIKLSEGVYTLKLDRPDEPIRWDASFYRGSDLTELHIPEGAEVIDSHGFEFCDNLTRVYMPKSMKHLGDAIFYGARQPVEIIFSGTEEEFLAFASPRRAMRGVQVPGAYDHQPYNNSEGTYYEEREVTEAFDHFCKCCKVVCEGGVTLRFGYSSEG